MAQKRTIGSLETVSIRAFGIKEVLAKIDTGAFSGALHCTDIVEHDGVLQFSPLGDQALRVSVTTYKQLHVRSATGHIVDRYLVPIEIEVRGKTYETVIGLSNRTMMKREMLLGRRFLLENGMVVDVSLTRHIDDEAEYFLEV